MLKLTSSIGINAGKIGDGFNAHHSNAKESGDIGNGRDFRTLGVNFILVKMKKAQAISMDFVMAFVIYLIVLTLFFVSLNNAFSTENKGLDVPFELLMSRIDQIYSNDDFLRRSEINPGKFDTYFYSYSKESVYDFIFKDFENSQYKHMDYCILIQDEKNRVLRNYPAGKRNSTIIITGNVPCGTNPRLDYENATPQCTESIVLDSLVLSKPVLFGTKFAILKLLICAEK